MWAYSNQVVMQASGQFKTKHVSDNTIIITCDLFTKESCASSFMYLLIKSITHPTVLDRSTDHFLCFMIGASPVAFIRMSTVVIQNILFNYQFTNTQTELDQTVFIIATVLHIYMMFYIKTLQVGIQGHILKYLQIKFLCEAKAIAEYQY